MGISPIHWLIVLIPLAAIIWVVVALMRRSPSRDLVAPPPKRAAPAVTSVETEAEADPVPDVTLPDDVATKVWAELRFGRQVNAIKLVHDSTDLDLRQSKALIDDMRRRDSDLR